MRFVKTVTTVLAIVAGFLAVSGYGLQTSLLLALIGVAGLALSLSVQGLMSNFFSGCLLPITKPFREGDVIEVGGTTGFIERIGCFSTTPVTISNVAVIIPNSVLASGCITNCSTRKTLMAEKTFNVAPNMQDKDAKAALREAIGKDPRILTDSEPFIRLESFNFMSATYNVMEKNCYHDFQDRLAQFLNDGACGTAAPAPESTEEISGRSRPDGQ